MARKIIIQERINEPSDFSFKAVFWADVPAARQSIGADATRTSVVKDATVAELDALKSGAVQEKQEIFQYVAGTPIATIQADLISKFNVFQALVNSTNPGRYYGTSWDGNSWTVKTTA